MFCAERTQRGGCAATVHALTWELGERRTAVRCLLLGGSKISYSGNRTLAHFPLLGPADMLYIPRMLIASLGWAGSELLVDLPGRLLSRAALARPASRSSGTETPPEAGTAAPDMGRSAPWMYHQDPASGVKLEGGGNARRSPTTATRNAAGAASKSCSVVGAASKSLCPRRRFSTIWAA